MPRWGPPAAMTRRIDLLETYDRIAHHFARTRPEPWPEVAAFLADRNGAIGLDIGVGNGRHAEPLAARSERVIGLDFSRSALQTAADRARRRGFTLELVRGEASHLPLRTDSVDLAVYIATIHHLPTREDRRRSLNELDRVLTADGAAIVSAWCTTHPRFDRDGGFDTTIDWTLPDGDRLPRFYHIYDPAEFRTEVSSSSLGIERVFVSEGNAYAVVQAGG